VATTFSWGAPVAIATALTTELNSLANAAFCTASSAYDNETSHHLYLDVELVLASLTPTGTPFCALFLIAQLDGTNYEDIPNAASVPVAIFPFTTAVAAKRQIKTNILVPPLPFKFVIQNNMGPALAASGNTLKYRLHDEQGV
jgi:hypothetical protein